ncbi:MAG TPA: hypothetical protein VMH23_10030 [Bacteroidota bacterium]|nr:hypothetical protein [Bacteroidota bacterium]
MSILSSFKEGSRLSSRTKRMILFAWFLNLLFAMTLALPFLRQLDGYLRGTVMDEKILQQMDPAWLESYRMDMEKSEMTRAFDLTTLGYGPFFNHLEMQMEGGFIKTTAQFLYDFFIRWQLNTGPLSSLFLMSLLYICVNTFLAGGFVGMYSRSYRSSFPEFLTECSRYFGKFLRLALVALIVYYLFYALIVDWMNNSIYEWTQSNPSETVPFTYYMVRNVVVVLLMSFLFMVFDYAKVRMVLDDRTSALGAAAAGIRFTIPHIGSTYGLYMLLTAIGIVFALLYAMIERSIPQSSYWPLVFLFMIQQVYMIARFWLKATFYSSQIALYRTTTQKEHLEGLSPAATAVS